MSDAARAAGVGVLSAWSHTPWFLTTPPEEQAMAIARGRVVDTIEAAAARHPVIAIGAPSGYGKSTAAAQWARRTDLPVAWLSLTRFDGDADRITGGVLSALRGLLPDEEGLEGLVARRDLHDIATVVDLIAAEISDAGERVALVVDQAEFAEDLGSSLVGALAAKRPDGLTLIVLGTTPAEDLLRALGRPLGAHALGADDLAMTDAEIRELAAAIGSADLDDAGAAEILQLTAGWPIAVRIALLSRTHGATRDLADYVDDAVLTSLPDELAQFVRAAVTAQHLDSALAATLAERSDAGALLEECVRRGIFVDRFTRASGTRVYVWHAAFRSAVLTSEATRRPDAVRRRHEAVGDAIESTDPLSAVEHFLAAGRAGRAYAVVLASWLDVLQDGRARALDRACGELPDEYAGRAAILWVRACCAWMRGDPAGARILVSRATKDAAATPLEEAVSVLASILVIDDPAVLTEGVRRAREIAATPGLLSGRTVAYALYIAGYTELRLRRDPSKIIANLYGALRECEAQGLPRMAARVAASLAFACAFDGRFTEALELADRGRGHDASDDEWQVYDAGAVAVTEGFIAYWRNDLAAARAAFAPIVTGGHGASAYGPVALMYDALSAAASGDRTWQTEALARLHEMPAETILGVPWAAFRACALGELAAAHGRMDDAVRLTAVNVAASEAPVPRAYAAEILRRAGDLDGARAVVAQTDAASLTTPARVSLLLTDALLRDDAGREDAHIALEKALDLAAPERIVRPFVAASAEIGALLENHAVWGTTHGAFVAHCLAQRRPDATESGGASALSTREREILAYLRTPLTLSEIAAALFLSSNTVKTHVRSVYRKLGVQSRRDAVRMRL